jgi:DNA-binding transcriptional LysR family regulator
MAQTSFDWNHLRVFYIVAEAGSFTEAGKKLYLSQSAVSRQIAALEQDLGVPLFHRHARGLVMTEAGESLFETARELSVKLLAVEEGLLMNHAAPRGRLRVYATVGLGGFWLASRVHRFIAAHPEVDFSLSVLDYELDLSKAEADCGIQVKPANTPGTIQKVFTNYTVGLYATEEYLDSSPTLRNFTDLDSHKLIAFDQEHHISPYFDVNWHLTAGTKEGTARKPVLRINNFMSIRLAAEQGAGIASLPDYMVEGTKNLVRIPGVQSTEKLQAYFVYNESLKNSKRIAIFRDFIIDEAKKTQFIF